MSTSKVSVITPLYNSSQYIEATLDSLCGQTHRDWESILVDDGSADDTARKVEPYLKDRRFTYLRQSNRGIAAARNAGIRAARGAWVCLLDHDDRWARTKLEKQLEFAASKNYDITCTDAVVVEGTSRTLYHTLFPDDLLSEVERHNDDPNGDVFGLLIRTDFLCASSVMIRKSFFDELGLLDESAAPADDYEMWLRCMPGARIGYLSEPLIEYVLHGNNYSRNRIKMAEKVIYALTKTMKRCPDGGRVKQFEESLIFQYRFLFAELLGRREHARAAGHALRLLLKDRVSPRVLSESAPRAYYKEALKVRINRVFPARRGAKNWR